MAAKKLKTAETEKTEVKVKKTVKAKVAAPSSLVEKVEKKAKPAKKAVKAKKESAETKTVKEVAVTKPVKTKVTTKTAKKAAKAEAEEAAAAAPAEDEATTVGEEKKIKQSRVRGAKYQAVRAKIDKTKLYHPEAAVELVKKLSYSHFKGSLEVHLIVREAGQNLTLTLPHSTGKKVKVAIASDEVLAAVEKGIIDFDVLVSTAQFMPKLAKFARVLGPKGLMPNPKAGTLTDKPEVKKAELEGGKVTIKTEKKAPLIHTTIGSISMETKALVENLEALLKAGNGKILKASICSTMSPGVRVLVE